jgi:hypothetical protein
MKSGKNPEILPKFEKAGKSGKSGNRENYWKIGFGLKNREKPA